MTYTPSSLFEFRIQEVAKFNKYFKLPYSDVPVILPEQILRDKIGFIKSEIEEFYKAVKENNKVEILDALVDIEYFLLGLVCAYGLQDELINKWGTFLSDQQKFDKCDMRYRYPENLTNVVLHCEALVSSPDRVEGFFNACTHLLNVVSDFWMMNKFQAAFQIIHKSNMSKLCYSKLECEMTISAIMSGPGEQTLYDSVCVNTLEGIWKVVRLKDGKVQKSINYKAPDLSVLFNEFSALCRKYND